MSDTPNLLGFHTGGFEIFGTARYQVRDQGDELRSFTSAKLQTLHYLPDHLPKINLACRFAHLEPVD
ncbi:hypothetical protein A0H81_02584 [Grifola frondosa]|uniref:Uncharacterized protein n=1 Tax=Grifola frondosa TaxID=5627 RepID=A0A1C7MNA8_GRIFR|nr:hypothetical protein A0H81_02584 [Grifola frondosa]